MEQIELIKVIGANIEKVIIGKEKEIYNVLKGILAGGHILIEDVPGVGKTMLVKALAKSVDLSYKRIQFTPDLLPSDITGISIYNQKEMEFEFKKGPIFANLVLADEINRTSAKTQSALLQVMEEIQVSEGNTTYELQKPFFVLATQNPIEQEGTFILPEAQLDRFIMKVKMGYADKESEKEILNLYRNNEPFEDLKSVATREDIIALQKKVREIFVSDIINDYVVNLIDATRNNDLINLGVSTRGALALVRIAQATALIDGRDYVVPEDVKSNVLLTLAHRISPSYIARSSNYDSEEILKEILKTIPMPRVK